MAVSVEALLLPFPYKHNCFDECRTQRSNQWQWVSFFAIEKSKRIFEIFYLPTIFFSLKLLSDIYLELNKKRQSLAPTQLHRHCTRRATTSQELLSIFDETCFPNYNALVCLSCCHDWISSVLVEYLKSSFVQAWTLLFIDTLKHSRSLMYDTVECFGFSFLLAEVHAYLLLSA